MELFSNVGVQNLEPIQICPKLSSEKFFAPAKILLTLANNLFHYSVKTPIFISFGYGNYHKHIQSELEF